MLVECEYVFMNKTPFQKLWTNCYREKEMENSIWIFENSWEKILKSKWHLYESLLFKISFLFDALVFN